MRCYKKLQLFWLKLKCHSNIGSSYILFSFSFHLLLHTLCYWAISLLPRTDRDIINEISRIRIFITFVEAVSIETKKKNRMITRIKHRERKANIDKAQTSKYRNLFPNNRNPIIQRLSSLSYPAINIPYTHHRTEQTHSDHETSELIRETIRGIHDFIAERARSYGNFA